MGGSRTKKDVANTRPPPASALTGKQAHLPVHFLGARIASILSQTKSPTLQSLDFGGIRTTFTTSMKLRTT